MLINGLVPLDTLADHLNSLVQTNGLQISQASVGEEGRFVSVANEGQVIAALQRYFDRSEGVAETHKLVIPKGRHWFDFALEDAGGGFIPVNIKSTEGKSADNCGSKEGVFFSLTGRLPSASQCRDYETYFAYLRSGLLEALADPALQDRDYLFLVCLKSRTGPPRFFVQSLRSIGTLTANGNNPPFQCAWARNQTRVLRDFKDGARTVLEAYQASMGQRAAQYERFMTELGPLLKNLAQPT